MMTNLTPDHYAMLLWSFSSRIIGARPTGFIVRDYAGDVVCIVPQNKRTQSDCENIARAIVRAHNSAVSPAIEQSRA
jgi:hypothetical protein